MLPNVVDTGKLVTVLTSAAVAFAVLKTMFSLVGWYTATQEDGSYRRHLDRLHDKLSVHNLGFLAERFFRQFYLRSRATWYLTTKARWRFAILSFWLNLIVMTLCWPDIRQYPITIAWSLLVYGLVGTFLDTMFGLITAKQLEIALRTRRSVGLGLFVLKDVGLMVFATYLNWTATSAFNRMLFELPGEARPTLSMEWLQGPVEELLTVMRYHPGRFALYLVGASLPTAIYLTLGLMVVVAFATPARVQEVVKRVVFNVTTDSSPLFTQLGTAFGSMGAIIVALLSWLRVR